MHFFCMKIRSLLTGTCCIVYIKRKGALMIAGVFLLFFLALVLAFIGYRKPSLVVAAAALLSGALMLIHHMTETIPIRL